VKLISGKEKLGFYVYVIADIGGMDSIPEFGADYPPAGSPLPQLTPFHESNFIWVFTGDHRMDHALHFVGWLQSKANGLRVFVFNTNRPAEYY
jgi:hypothetical protein